MDRVHASVQVGAHQCSGYPRLIHDKLVLWKQTHYLVLEFTTSFFIPVPIRVAVDVRH